MRYGRAVRASEDCPLGFYARFVYGSLLRCKGRASTVGALHGWLGLSGDCIRRARGELISHGLAEVSKGRIRALEPKGDAASWFPRFKPKPGEFQLWNETIKYIKVPIPSQASEIGHRGGALLMFIVGRPGGSTYTYGYLGSKLGIDWRTAKRLLCKLDQAGFTSHPGGSKLGTFRVEVLDSAARPDWFLAKGEVYTPKPRARKIDLQKAQESVNMCVSVGSKGNDIRPENVEYERVHGDRWRSHAAGVAEGCSFEQRQHIERLARLCGFNCEHATEMGRLLGDPRLPSYNELTERLSPGGMDSFKRWYRSWLEMRESELVQDR